TAEVYMCCGCGGTPQPRIKTHSRSAAAFRKRLRIAESPPPRSRGISFSSWPRAMTSQRISDTGRRGVGGVDECRPLDPDLHPTSPLLFKHLVSMGVVGVGFGGRGWGPDTRAHLPGEAYTSYTIYTNPVFPDIYPASTLHRGLHPLHRGWNARP